MTPLSDSRLSSARSSQNYWYSLAKILKYNRKGQLPTYCMSIPGSAMRSATVRSFAMTDPLRLGLGPSSAISPTWRPAPRVAISLPLIEMPTSPLTIRYRSLSALPCWMSVFPGLMSSNVPAAINCCATAFSPATTSWMQRALVSCCWPAVPL